MCEIVAFSWPITFLATRYEFSDCIFELCVQFWQTLICFGRHVKHFTKSVKSQIKVRQPESPKSDAEPKVRLYQSNQLDIVILEIYGCLCIGHIFTILAMFAYPLTIFTHPRKILFYQRDIYTTLPKQCNMHIYHIHICITYTYIYHFYITYTLTQKTFHHSTGWLTTKRRD